jgi:quercetin dioxygenase-like cupin family protein
LLQRRIVSGRLARKTLIDPVSLRAPASSVMRSPRRLAAVQQLVQLMRGLPQVPHPRESCTMTTQTATRFSHVKPGDTAWRSDGLRDFFLYKDLGVAAATNGQVIAHLVKANMAPEKGTGWHRHEADFQIVLMTRGWAKFMYGDRQTLVEAGDCVHQMPGIVHYLFDYSPDMEYLEIVSPANFKSIDMPAPADVPAAAAW